MPVDAASLAVLYERSWGDYDTDYVFPAAGLVLLVGLALLVAGARAWRRGVTGRAPLAWLAFGGAFSVGGAAWLGWATLIGWTGAIAVEPVDVLVIRASGLLAQERRIPIEELATAHLFHDPIERGAPLRLILVDRRGVRHDVVKVYRDRGARLEPVIAQLRGRVPLSDEPPGRPREAPDGP